MTSTTENPGVRLQFSEFDQERGRLVVSCETGCITYVSDEICQLLGHTRRHLLGRHIAEISPPLQPDGTPSAEGARQKLHQLLEEGAFEFEWIHLDAFGDEVTCEISIEPADRAAHESAGSAWLKARPRPSDESVRYTIISELHQRIADIEDVGEALEMTVAYLARLGGWPYAEVWRPGAHGEVVPATVWSVEDTGLKVFAEASLGFRFQPGEGLPGRVMRTATPEWWPDVAELETEIFCRRDLAREAGLHAAYSIPVVLDGRVQAVFIFYRLCAMPEFKPLSAYMQLIVDQLQLALDRQVAEDRFRQERRMLQSVEESTPVTLFQLTLRTDGKLLLDAHSDKLLATLGCESNGIVLERDEFLACVLEEDRDSVTGLMEASAKTLQPVDLTVRLTGRDGGLHWIQARGTPARNTQGEVIWDGVARDVTAEKQLAQSASYHSHHDPVTGLLNRTGLLEKLSQQFERQRVNDACFIVIELPDVPEISLSVGIDAADNVLAAVAGQVRELVGQKGLCARTGTAELVVTFLAVEQMTSLVTVLDELQSVIGEAALAAADPVRLKSTLGVYIAEDSTQVDLKESLRCAGIALARAKHESPEGWALYMDGEEDRFREAFHIRSELEQAIINDEIVVHYQPQVDSELSRIVGWETLVRWEHPQRGMLLPGAFIGIAERTGLLDGLTERTIASVACQVREWRDAGFEPGPVSVNVSPTQITGGSGIPQMFERAMRKYDLAGADLQVELTETTILHKSDATAEFIEALEKLGIGIMLDDFGSGYSSLQHLTDIPYVGIKIDRSFARNCLESEPLQAMIGGIFSMAHAMDVMSVFEGVETAEQFEMARRLGCNAIQGFYFSKAVPAPEATALLREYSAVPRAGDMNNDRTEQPV